VPNPEPSDLEVAKLLASISRRIARLAKHHGIELDRPNEQVECLDPLASESPLLAGICGASVLGRIATGVRAGQPVLRIGRRADAPLVTRSGKRQAHSEGFDLHVNVAVPAGDRTRLEHLSRYVLRPPLHRMPSSSRPSSSRRKLHGGVPFVLGFTRRRRFHFYEIELSVRHANKYVRADAHIFHC
jgi:hypothetical protein